MNPQRMTIAVLITSFASLALADDIKTVSGKEYKNATVSRVEPDGLMVKFSGGLVKIPFTDLSKELQQLYHYDPEASQRYAADNARRSTRIMRLQLCRRMQKSKMRPEISLFSQS